MSAHLIKQLFVAGIYLICSCISEQIENNTLIYDWDVNHRINLYCQFASTEELKSVSIQRKCLTKNKQMQHILPDGTKTFPYAAYGSKVGFILKCGNITYGNLQPNCNRYVYTNCSYTCGTSDVVHTATCNLVGPWDNVTSQWSTREPCAVPPSTSETEVPSTIAVTPASTVSSANGNTSITPGSVPSTIPVTPASTVSSANGNTSITPGSGDTSDDESHVVIAVTVLIAILLGVIIVTVCCYKRKYKQRPSRQAHQNLENNYHLSPQEPLTADQTSQLQPCSLLIEHAEGEANNNTTKDKECEGHIRPLTANNNTTKDPECGGLKPQTGIAELPEHMRLLDHNYAENNHKYKGLSGISEYTFVFEDGTLFNDVGDKDLLDALNGYSTLNCESLNDIHVENISGGTVAYKKPNGFVANPDMCNATVELLKEQTNSYRKWLRAELEVIPGRSREQALIGYMEENARDLGYMPNEIKLLEKSYETQVDQKVSDEFLHKLAAYGVKLGNIVQYFYLHGNREAIAAIIDVHRDCWFCRQFKRL